MKENNTWCYPLDEVLTSPSKPKLLTIRGLPEKVVQHATHMPPRYSQLWLMSPTTTSTLCHMHAKWVPVLWEIGDKPMGMEYNERTVPAGDAADRSTK